MQIHAGVTQICFCASWNVRIEIVLTSGESEMEDKQKRQDACLSWARTTDICLLCFANVFHLGKYLRLPQRKAVAEGRALCMSISWGSHSNAQYSKYCLKSNYFQEKKLPLTFTAVFHTHSSAGWRKSLSGEHFCFYSTTVYTTFSDQNKHIYSI